MKKFLTYLLIIVVAVAIIGGVYWLVTCPSKGEVSEKPLPSLEEMQQKAAEAIASGNSYIAPHDPEMVVKDDGVSIVVNRIKVMLKEGEGKETAGELAKKVNGTVVGFIEPDIYQIELQTSTVKELENALSTVEADARVKVANKTFINRTVSY